MLEGLFTVVLRTGVNEAKYYFYTQNSGKDTVKSPLGMFTTYAIDNDLNYVVDKIRNYYELGDYKSDDEMNAADQAVASDLEKPDSKGRRTRGKKAESATPTDASEEKTGRTRKSRSEVQAENEQKIADHMDEVDKAIDQAFPGQEEVPFDEAMDVADKVPKPDLQKPPRRTRKERNAEKSEPVQDGTTNTDSESVTLEADAYFYVPADDKVQESTHIFLCDFTNLKNLSTDWVWNPFSFLTGVISKTDEQETVDVTSDNARMVVNGEVYEILLIDDPMNMHDHLEIYLRFIGGQ